MEARKRHVVCIPAPAQGHVNSMFKLAKLLHFRGFQITFIHTEFNFTRLAKALPSDSPSLDNFRFETIPDGLPPENKRGILDLPALCIAISGPRPKEALRSLLLKLLLPSDDTPPVTCIISDAHMNITYDIGKELGIPMLLLYTTSACSVLGFLHYQELVQKGLFPFKDESYFSNGFLDTTVDWIPGLKSEAKLKHLPSFIRTTDPHEPMFIHNIESASHTVDAGTLILNTFDDLEGDVLRGIKTKIPNIYTIGPLSLFCQQQCCDVAQKVGSNLWKEETNCLEWLDKRGPKSVVYVNYGSLTKLTPEQVEEFGWGLANSKQHFLWVLRNDSVDGESEYLSKEFMEEIKETGLVSGWCPQEKVLKHPAIKAFLTHCGWNSTLESICEGVPMMCWPFFADQQTNSFYLCDEWGVGLEIGEGAVKRGRVEEVVREVMEGEKGEDLRNKALEWKKKAEEATTLGGSSFNNFERLIKKIIGFENTNINSLS